MRIVFALALLLATTAHAAPPYWSLDVRVAADEERWVVVWGPGATDSGGVECFIMRRSVEAITSYWTERLPVMPALEAGEPPGAYFDRLKTADETWPGWATPIDLPPDDVVDLCHQADPRYLRTRWEPVNKPFDPATLETIEALIGDLVCGDPTTADVSTWPSAAAGQEYREVSTGRRTGVALCARMRFPRPATGSG